MGCPFHPKGGITNRAYIARVDSTEVSVNSVHSVYSSAGLDQLEGESIHVVCRGEMVAELGFGVPASGAGAEPGPGQLLASEVCEGVSGLIREGIPVPDFPLALIGTEFDRLVWSAIREVPIGQTVSYSELAHRIGRPGAHRAVARACGRNPTAILVPCHRVVAADGTVGGYRWGVGLKRALIEAEAKAG